MKYSEIFLILICFVILSCSPKDKNDQVQSWSLATKTEFPNVVLRNYVEIDSLSYSHVGCSFIIDFNSKYYLVTAKHILDFLERDQQELSDIKKWICYTDSNNSPKIELDFARFLPNINKYILNDWLVFPLKEKVEAIQALKVAKSKVSKNDELLAIGWLIEIDKPEQSFYRGKVFQLNNSFMYFNFNEKFEIGGLSGSPILNKIGNLIGMVSFGRGNLQQSPTIKQFVKLINRIENGKMD